MKQGVCWTKLSALEQELDVTARKLRGVCFGHRQTLGDL